MSKFKTRKEISDYFSGNFIECLLCGKKLKAVGGRHLSVCHGVTVDEYKKRFGLPLFIGLVCDDTKKKQAKALLARINAGDQSLPQNNKDIQTLMLKKARQAKRVSKFPPYHLQAMKGYAKKANDRSVKRSVDRINSMDWDGFLKLIQNRGYSIYSSKTKDEVPLPYDLEKKLKIDPSFKKEYLKITGGFKSKK